MSGYVGYRKRKDINIIFFLSVKHDFRTNTMYEQAPTNILNLEKYIKLASIILNVVMAH